MRLVERRVQEGTCDFIIEAPTPALAAGVLLTAYNKAREQCSNFVTLPNGQSRYIRSMFMIENSGLCRLLDAAGQEVKEIDPEWEGTTADEQQRNAQGICGQEQAGTTEPEP